MHTYIYVCMYVYVQLFVCLYIYMYVCMCEYNVSICRYVTIAAKEPGTFLSQTLQSGVFLHEWLVM